MHLLLLIGTRLLSYFFSFVVELCFTCCHLSSFIIKHEQALFRTVLQLSREPSALPIDNNNLGFHNSLSRIEIIGDINTLWDLPRRNHFETITTKRQGSTTTSSIAMTDTLNLSTCSILGQGKPYLETPLTLIGGCLHGLQRKITLRR